MWDRLEINVGNIKENSTIAVAFKYQGNGQDFQFKPSCGCASTTFNAKDNILTVSVRVDKIPIHLKMKGSYDLFKTVSVTYIENNVEKNDLLIIKGTVK